MLFHFIRSLFNLGFAVNAVVITFCIVAYVFFLTFVVCLFDDFTRKRQKGYFKIICVFAWIFICGCCILDRLSGKYFSAFSAGVVCAGSALVFLLQYIVLRLFELSKTKGDDVESTLQKADDLTVKKVITPVKRKKIAVVCETPAREIMQVAMQKVRLNKNGEGGYILECLARLKAKDMNKADEEKLFLAEKKLGGDKRCVNEALGAMVTLLAKYC